VTWFDRIFLLTIPKSAKGRAQTTLLHLREQGIEPEILLGIDGEAAGLDTRFPYQIDVPGTDFKISPRTIGIHLGHMMLWKVFEHGPGDSFLIFEDDVRFLAGWRETFDAGMPSLPVDWDMLYIGSCCCDGRKPIRVNGALHKVTYAMCLHAYAIRRKALPILWGACQKIYAGIDIAICLHAMADLQVYAFLPRLAEQDQTDIPP